MTKGSVGYPQTIDADSETTLTSPRSERQDELFPLTTLVEMPDISVGADAWGEVLASDSQRYKVKLGKGGEFVRAAEWVGTCLAEEMNVPCPTPKVIQLQNGELAFGSRIISGIADAVETAQILTSVTNTGSAYSIPGLRSLLSAIYALDMFINNVDRHDQNYISLDDNGTRRFYTIDYGRSLFWNGKMSGFPIETQQTRATFRTLHQRHGFDPAAADAMLNRLAAFTGNQMGAVFSRMPHSWLRQQLKDDFLRWWRSPERMERISTLRTGLHDGSLL